MASNRTIFAPQSYAMLTILNGQELLKNALRQARRSLEAVGANVLGTVMNNLAASKREYCKYRIID